MKYVILIVCAIAASVLTVLISKALGVEDPVMGGGMAGGIAPVVTMVWMGHKTEDDPGN